MPVRVVTDTSAGLPEHVARDLGITVLDLHMVGDEDDKSTSGLSSLELAAAYARQLERGGDAGVVALGMRVVAGQVAAAAAMGGMMPAHRSQGWGLEAAMMMLVRVMMPMGANTHGLV